MPTEHEMNIKNEKPFTIRKPKKHERDAWQSLWKQYLIYYKSADFASDLTELLWERIQDTNSPINCLVIENQSAQFLGFVHYSPQLTTWQREPECYLEDLFVIESQRGNGLGEQLIEAVVQQTKRNGLKEVYWQTQFDNAPARGLYDKITGGTDGYVIYRIEK